MSKFTEDPIEIAGGISVEWDVHLNEEVRTVVRTELARRPEQLPHGCTQLVVSRDLRERGGTITWCDEEVEGEGATSLRFVTSAWYDHPGSEWARRFVIKNLSGYLTREGTLVGLDPSHWHTLTLMLPSRAVASRAKAEDVATHMAKSLTLALIDIPATTAGSIAERVARAYVKGR